MGDRFQDRNEISEDNQIRILSCNIYVYVIYIYIYICMKWGRESKIALIGRKGSLYVENFMVWKEFLKQ